MGFRRIGQGVGGIGPGLQFGLDGFFLVHQGVCEHFLTRGEIGQKGRHILARRFQTRPVFDVKLPQQFAVGDDLIGIGFDLADGAIHSFAENGVESPAVSLKLRL